MRTFGSTSAFDLSDEWVAVCGDWHANVGWVRTAAAAISRMMPTITTILQLGDWWTEGWDRGAVIDHPARRVARLMIARVAPH